jgi:predicted proteasome-type protease
MSWEQRGDRRYYYRKRRDGDRVISEYVGAGELAETAAALDALEREARRAERQSRQEARALDAQIDEVCDLIRALTYAELLVAGYHTHKGQWRRKRHV